jgi:hypothetical protein
MRKHGQATGTEDSPLSTDNVWLYQGKPYTDANKEYYGFVYCITNLLTKRSYIGRKYFWSVRKVKGKKSGEAQERNR